MFPAPPKYMLEFNPGVPLRLTPGYKIGNTFGVVNTCHPIIMPRFSGVTSTNNRFG
jgi:hypothetical protein